MIQQRIQEDDEISISEDEEQKEFSTDFLKQSSDTITDMINQFIQINFNIDRSSKVRQSVIDLYVLLSPTACWMRKDINTIINKEQ